MPARDPSDASPVWIVILNWNRYRDTLDCVESCRRLDYPDRRILVVDNGSTDGSEAVLRGRWHDVSFLQTGANLGYAGGNNAGIRYALERGAAYVWLLNNDTIVDERCLAYMVGAAEADREVGIVGGKIYYLDRPTIVWSAGGTVDLRAGGATQHIGKDREDAGDYDAPARVDYVTGCSMMVRRETLSRIGLLDERYFLYFEDVDLCLRARDGGWTVHYEPRAHVWHREGARTSSGYSSTFIYYSLRNRLYFMKRFAPGWMWRCHRLQLEVFLFFLKGAVRQGPAALLKTLALGLRSYWDFYIDQAMGAARHGLLHRREPANVPPSGEGLT